MATRNSDSDERIAELERQSQEILEQIGRLRGSAVNPRVEMPLKSEAPDIMRLTERFMVLARDLSTLRSQAESQRLTRFKRVIDGNGPDDPEIRRWWHNRY